MYRKLSISMLFLCFCTLLSAQVERPKLVVGLMVDQMRWDYLYRFADRYGNDGFKRLLRDGFSCENAMINYVPTFTAIGHSSVYTGSVPSIHGIAGNDWIEQQSGTSMYCTQDDAVEGVGTAEKEGKQSPRNLLASTVTDQLKLATNFNSKVIGIAIKDRGGILPAGHFANAAYWFEAKSGDWISSTYYMEKLPEWVTKFNGQKLADKYLKQDWNTLYPIDTYKTNSIDDDNVYEGKWAGEETTGFPRKTSLLMKDAGYELIKTTPYGNSITLDFAKDAIKNEKLGHNPTKATDFLCVSLSATDYVGHRYSLSSVEIEDIYLRLDQELANFFKYLDETVGKGNYTFFLTADHAASYNSRYFMDMRGNGGYFFARQLQRTMNDELKEEFGSENLIISLMNYQVHLNYAEIEKSKLDEEKIKKSIIKMLRHEDGVAYVVDMEGGENMMVPAEIREKIINGYNRKRSGAIQIITEPQWYDGTPRSTGTTHGTWTPYDSHIPLVFMGWGIKSGKTNKVVNITDIAPTISSLLHVMEPNGSIGQPIVEVLQK
ncbi:MULTISPECIES: alkaline phosphatase PafA [Sphingobacterium]|uniref:Alkaline phosphatase family protein n=1 Tax=Sphingobacterium cellulitidis TaxID=1768011 RepID=A0A8H9FYB2_9SPHI|nr:MULTISPECIES: alkaline phosphatase PafA [Sphingobacterium]MBA8985354.1 putative AlkP superfamily pyrophosphatase or phosphodiesterase [Sphingobacterium soli]WFB63776.1 alkaline phosphatase family protein [Sphingobacterium sp. WM]GGE10330.1 alkaline phosphatase family protein [Sphingobacterium soli]